MKKIVKAVAPYHYEGQINFKHKPYDAWVKLGLPTAKAHYPWRWLHRLFFSFSFPRLFTSKKEARLCFVQPWTLYFDTFPSYLFYEIIPFFWDAWPSTYPKIEAWLRRYNVKTAIFTASATVEHMKQVFPEMNILWCPEGIDVENYPEGKELKDRKIDLLEFGRGLKDLTCPITGQQEIINNQTKFKYLTTWSDKRKIRSSEELYELLSDSKITTCLPKTITHPEKARGLETLTQRYWEAMLTRSVIVGHCPLELKQILGYNPILELENLIDGSGLINVLNNIESYQNIVNRNREAAILYGDWGKRINMVFEFLTKNIP